MIITPEKRQEQIDEIMDNFNFEKVQIAMRALNWTWQDASEAPSIPELRQAARGYLKSLPLDQNGFCASGGLHAEVVEGVLKLAFEVEDWSVE